MIAPYPEPDPSFFDSGAELIMGEIIEIVHAIRNARAEYKVDITKWITAEVYAGAQADALQHYQIAIETLAHARPVVILAERHGANEESKRRSATPERNALVLVLKNADVVIPVESMINLTDEKTRLSKEIAGAEAEFVRLEGRLADPSFLAKAPAAVVIKDKERFAMLQDKLTRLKQERNRLG
jgi:valyl-tRNA synthetase